jgi:hypothetical protein
MAGKPDLLEKKSPQWRSGIAERRVIEIQQKVIYGIVGSHRILQEAGSEEHHIPGIVDDNGLEGGNVLRLQRFDEWFVHVEQVKNGPPAWKGERSFMK